MLIKNGKPVDMTFQQQEQIQRRKGASLRKEMLLVKKRLPCKETFKCHHVS